jgi:hypothetical protein
MEDGREMVGRQEIYMAVICVVYREVCRMVKIHGDK